MQRSLWFVRRIGAAGMAAAVLSAALVDIGGAQQSRPTSGGAAPQGASAELRSGVVAGVVVEGATRRPLAGVQVLVQGSGVGALSDAAGRYRLTGVPAGEVTVMAQRIGFGSARQTVTVGTGATVTVNFELAEQAVALSEVVVVGYGTQQRRDVSSAIASLNLADSGVETMPVLVSAEQAMQGRLAGVSVIQNSGTPGAGATLRIRGATSINAANDPLYVVDGVPVNTGNYAGAGGGAAPLNALATLNPSDIESIEVLKDASAAAIYGSRASNGVVLITTRRGQAGRTRVALHSSYGVQREPRRLPLLNGPEWGELVNEARRNVGLAPAFENPASLPSTDWQDLIFRAAPVHSHELSVSGGSENTSFYLSGGYYNQDGIIIASGFERANLRSNLEQRINDNLRVGLNLGLTRSLNQRVSEDSRSGILRAATIKSPAVPAFNPDGTLNGVDPYIANMDNPLAIAQEVSNRATTNRAVGNAFAELRIPGGVQLRTSWGADYMALAERVFVPPNELTLTGRTLNGSGTHANTQDLGWLNENTLRLERTLGGRHRVSALVGNSLQESHLERTTGSATNFALESIGTLSSASIRNAGSMGSSWGLTSYFGRVNYALADRYIVEASYRRDASSRFSENNQWAAFPSVSAAWRIVDEPWLRDVGWLSELKLRGSWGLTGNQAIGDFTSRGLAAGGFNYMGRSGLAPVQLPNPDLTWETTEQVNVGLDKGFLNNRIVLTTDVYIKNTRDLLLEVQLPQTSGFATSLQNIGNVRNRGVEFHLVTRNVEGRDFSWGSDFNISFNRNRVTHLPVGDRFLGFNGYASIIREGYPLGTFFGWKILGVDPETGNYRFLDVDGDGNTPFATDADRVVLGSAQPDFTGGLANTLRYRGVELNGFLQFVYGNQVFNESEYSYGRLHTWFNSSTLARERWRQPGDQTRLHRAAWGDPTRNGSVSDRVLQDGSYLRLKSLTLSYDVPAAYLRRRNFNLENLRLYATGQNLLTLTRYQGFDPEVNGFGDDVRLGFDFSEYPQARTVSVGFNIGF